ncbi:MAG: hypothetical protein HYS81_00760 [Candidatus Aenigmatarchaeota archaeon]|nr:MAG: hypothetical protein HYS81_00760 [Candidatus Aenigmarchaeota archaeon]
MVFSAAESKFALVIGIVVMLIVIAGIFIFLSTQLSPEFGTYVNNLNFNFELRHR